MHVRICFFVFCMLFFYSHSFSGNLREDKVADFVFFENCNELSDYFCSNIDLVIHKHPNFNGDYYLLRYSCGGGCISLAVSAYEKGFFILDYYFSVDDFFISFNFYSPYFLLSGIDAYNGEKKDACIFMKEMIFVVVHVDYCNIVM